MALLWFLSVVMAIAQTPAADLDSITEDSYQRMLARQAADQETDSLISSQTMSILTEPAVNEWEWWYVLLIVEVLVMILLLLGHNRKKTQSNDRLKK